MWNDKKGYNNKYRGISSLGRAVGSQSAGRGIETPIFHIFLSVYNPKETKKIMAVPGFEPGSSGSQPLMLTTTLYHQITTLCWCGFCFSLTAVK